MNNAVISVEDIVVGEGDTTATFIVTLNHPWTKIVSVTYFTEEQTASDSSSDGDYIYQNETLNFAVGETTKTVVIPLVEDNVEEGEEIFGLSLYNPSNGIIGDEIALATIVENELSSPELSAKYFDVIQEPRAAGQSVDVQFEVENTEAGSTGEFELTLPALKRRGFLVR